MVFVITLTGSSYVSRIALPFLQFNQFCASDISDYLSIAIKLAENKSWLRQNRDYWRNSLSNSPLGDTSQLLHAIDHALVDMANLR